MQNYQSKYRYDPNLVIKTITGSDFTNCSIECRKDNNCQFWTYEKDEQICTLIPHQDMNFPKIGETLRRADRYCVPPTCYEPPTDSGLIIENFDGPYRTNTVIE